jgi:hypothetical protein
MNLSLHHQTQTVNIMLNRVLQPARAVRHYLGLPSAAKAALRTDRHGLPREDPGIERAVRESVAWLGRAQDNSSSADGGIARDYSLISGWNASYPETTGYAVPTLLAYANSRSDDEVRKRARRMVDWLVSIQLFNGGFQGGTIGARPIVPVTFNTGQILIGLAASVRELGDEYRPAMRRAADGLVKTQDSDGCWRKHPSPFAISGEKVYETHVAWGLFEAARVEAGRGYAEAGLRNVQWALRFQHENGWFENCCLSEPRAPLTHTLGYTLRGLLEAHRFTGEASLLDACRRTADGLLTALSEDGFLPGRLEENWRAAVPWACLTGTVQIAYCWLALYRLTRETRYRQAAFAANRYVRRTISVDGPPEIRGAIKGSFPIDGDYCAYAYPNWASKFFIDSNLLEEEIRREDYDEH